MNLRRPVFYVAAAHQEVFLDQVYAGAYVTATENTLGYRFHVIRNIHSGFLPVTEKTLPMLFAQFRFHPIRLKPTGAAAARAWRRFFMLGEVG